MTMISSAQNFEDVMLARAFAGQREGFYIDVGAWHPTIDSVTRHFYDLGWRGINIEPTPVYHRLLAEDRPRDVNLNLAVGEQDGEAELAVYAESGGSSLSADYQKYFDRLGLERTTHNCRIATLAAICSEHAPARIDFLKIDVEGWERQVISGADWKRFRPRILVIEAVRPNSLVPAWSDWEPLLADAGYRFVYFDAINRFYVAEEENAALGRHFTVPPNVLDDFVSRRTWLAEQAVLRLSGERKTVSDSDPVVEALQTQLWTTHLKLDQIVRSRSWRVTAPLRGISKRLSR